MKFLLKLLNLAPSKVTDGSNHAGSASRSKRDRGRIVLGQGLADARDAERKHRLNHANAPSPMPSDRYEEWRGDYDLIDLQPLQLDADIQEVCRVFRQASTQEQRAMRDALSMDDFYTLLTFGKRASVRAIRGEDVSIADDGLTAIAMVDLARIDHRDASMSLGLLDHALQRLRANADERIEQASRLALPEIAEVLLHHTKRPAGHRRLSSWLYEECESSRGVGFVRRGFDPYSPLSDLFSVAMDIAAVINGDSYRADIELASSMPAVWLQGHDDAAVSKALASVTGGVKIDGKISPETNQQRLTQQLTVFLVETGSEEWADKLLAISKLPAKWHFRLGTASGKLFSLMVARSVREGVESFESAESLQRFEAPLQRALDRHCVTDLSQGVR